MNKIEQIKELKMLLESGAIDEGQYTLLLSEIIGTNAPVVEKYDKFETKQLNEYNSVSIGNQVWMTENLNLKTFRNGDPIIEASKKEQWDEALEKETPAWCYYDDDQVNGAKYGLLYNYYAVNDKRGLAPFGWAIPNENDFKDLLMQVDGKSLRSRDNWSYYLEFNEYDDKEKETYKSFKVETSGGTNKSGFNLKPSGFYNSGVFSEVDFLGILWIKDSLSKFISEFNNFIGKEVLDSYSIKYFKQFWIDDCSTMMTRVTNSGGFSVRCIKIDEVINLKNESEFNEISEKTKISPDCIKESSLPNDIKLMRITAPSEDITEITILSLLKKVGDSVNEGDVIAEIETDKATLEKTSLYTGTILFIGVYENFIVPINSLLAIIGPHDADISQIVANYKYTGKKTSLKESNISSEEIPKTYKSEAERLVAEFGLFDPKLELSNYKYPSLDLLQEVSSNEEINLKSLFSSTQFQETEMELPIVLGKRHNNEPFVIDLVKNKNIIIMEAFSQSGIDDLNLDDTILTSLLFKKHPAEIKFILFKINHKIENHYLAKLPTSKSETLEYEETLKSLSLEKENRNSLLKDAGVKNIREYNNRLKKRQLNSEAGHRFLPYLIIFINNPRNININEAIYQLGNSSDLVGIYLIFSTNIYGFKELSQNLIDSFSTKITYKLYNKKESLTFLGNEGAERINKNEIIYSFENEFIRLQYPSIDDLELMRIYNFISSQKGYNNAYLLPEFEEFDISIRDNFFLEAAEIIVTAQQGSASLLQRKLNLGFNRANRLIDELEIAGIVSPFEGSKARNVIIPDLAALRQLFINEENKKNIINQQESKPIIKEETITSKIFGSFFNRGN